jgi:hypothetical protein
MSMPEKRKYDAAGRHRETITEDSHGQPIEIRKYDEAGRHRETESF